MRLRFSFKITVIVYVRSDCVGSRVYACLGVTCHLRFWQNDRDLLRATVVTGMERTPNKSQHIKLTLEKKILLLFLPEFKLATVRSRVWNSTNKLSHPGQYNIILIVNLYNTIQYNTTLLSPWGNTFNCNMNMVKYQTSHKYAILEA